MHTDLQYMWLHAHTVQNTRLPPLHSDHSVLTLLRALSLPCLLNSIWKHNERMTRITTPTSRLLHQCFHPLAFSFSTHHFPLLCDWGTMTTSESWGWSYMKEAEGVEPTVMWLALSLHTPGSSSPPWIYDHFFFSFLVSFSRLEHYYFFSLASLSVPSCSLTPNFKSQSIMKQKHNYFTIYVAMSTIFLNPPANVWTHTHTHTDTHTHGCVLHPIMAPESRPSSRPLRPTLTNTTI